MKKSRRKTFKSGFIKYFLWGSVIILLAGVSSVVYFSLFNDFSYTVSEPVSKNEGNLKSDSSFLKAVLKDSVDDFVTYSTYKDFVEFDQNAGNSLQPRYTGRRINIAIVGLDSRIGSNSNHADANHVLSILLDSGKIEIISVPRDTPADAGYHDSTGQNKLTVVRASRGRDAYLVELARIAQLDQIHYYIEVSFSQVIGFLEFFGYRDPKSTLQVLRSRKGLGGDDFQRTYNQAQFIRQMILKNYHKVNTGVAGELLLRGGLALLTTNVNYDVLKIIISKLNMFGFPRSSEDIFVKIRPPIPIKFKVYNFTDDDIVSNLIRKVEQFNISHNEIDSVKVNVYYLLDKNLTFAERDTSKFPKRVIARLGTFYNQKSWLQIENLELREQIRTRFENCLVTAYNKLKQFDNANNVSEQMRLEREFFKLKNNLSK